MTPEMLLQLVVEDEFDPEEVEQVAGSDIAYFGSLTTTAPDGTRLAMEPRGKFSASGDQQWVVYFLRDLGAVKDAVHVAGELWRYKSWEPGMWSAHPNPTFYHGPSWGGYMIKASGISDAAAKLFGLLKSSKRKAFPA